MAASELAVALAVGQHVRGDVGEERHDGVEHRHLDPLAEARAGTLEEGGRDAVGGVDAGGDVGNGWRRLDRRAVGLAGVPHEAAGGLEDEIHAGLLRERAARAERRDRAVDEARVPFAQRVVAEPVPLHHARAEVLDQHVGLRDEAADERRARLLPDVDRDAALVPVEPLEVEPADLGREPSGAVGVADAVAATRLLHLDDVGAEVAEQGGAPRTGGLVAQVDDADARKGRAPVAGAAHQQYPSLPLISILRSRSSARRLAGCLAWRQPDPVATIMPS